MGVKYQRRCKTPGCRRYITTGRRSCKKCQAARALQERLALEESTQSRSANNTWLAMFRLAR